MTRPTNPSDPTAERTADQTTQSAGGLSGGKPDPGSRDTVARDERETEDLIARRREERATTPRRYEEADDAVLPADDATLRTEI